MEFGSLFSGIGGLDFGLERAGMHCAWQVEIDDYCLRVLGRHWPDVLKFRDVREVHGAEECPSVVSDPQRQRRNGLADPATGNHRNGQGTGRSQEVRGAEQRCPLCLPRVDLIAGGFPCQPVSLAGRRRGAADERWLWPHFARLVRVLRPRYVLVENVPGLLAPWRSDDGRWNPAPIEEVVGDLAEGGYDAEWDCVAAAHVDAPHLRYRVFVVAYPQCDRLERSFDPLDREGANGWGRRFADTDSALAVSERNGLEGVEPTWSASGSVERAGEMADSEDPDGRGAGGSIYSGWWDSQAGGRGVSRAWTEHWLPEPAVGRVADGVPSRVDRLRGLGNAVVPQVAEFVGRQIVEAQARARM